MKVLFIFNIPVGPVVTLLSRLPFIEAKVVYWINGSIDVVGLQYWVAWADKVVVEDGILHEVKERISAEVILLSDFLLEMDPGIRRRVIRLQASRDCKTEKQKNIDRPILFFAANDTIAKMFSPIIEHLDKFYFATPYRDNEGASVLLSRIGIPYLENRRGLVDEVKPSVIVFGNDWGGEVIQVIYKARQLGIPTICIQEGCLDWDGPARRIGWADFPFVQGPLTLKYLHRNSYFITGNPRFDSLQKIPLPKNSVVMINCNFTYGIYEDIREQWIESVVSSCKALGLDFFISQHPRDKGSFPNLPLRKSNVSVVHEHIAESSLLITRFSTLVYEAMLMGRPVIYYNPHGEKMKTFNEDTTGGLVKVNKSTLLSQAIQSSLDNVKINEFLRESFLNLHCGSHDNLAGRRCALAIESVATAGIVDRSLDTVCRKRVARISIRHYAKIVRDIFR
jgi:hypothetical protein